MEKINIDTVTEIHDIENDIYTIYIVGTKEMEVEYVDLIIDLKSI